MTLKLPYKQLGSIMLYQEKDLDMTICIISMDGDFSKIEKTKKTSEFLAKKYPVIGVIPESKTVMPASLPVYQGGNCVTSMIDKAMNECKSDWAYIVFAGSVMKKQIDKKLSYYVEKKQDVLFPVVDRIYNFITGSMNGILMNKEFYHEVGEFGSGNSLQDTKVLWAEKALNKGVKFKAIVNACNI